MKGAVHFLSGLRFAIVALLVAGLAGCVETLATGQQIDPGLTTIPQAPTGRIDPQEVAIAEREHPKILASFGGTFDDPDAEVAIARAVGRLVAASSEPWRNYRVTILNSPAVNAFALPGGYVYVTRGLLALANDTSEVAAVIAHEMAHVTARHAFSRAEKAANAAVANRVVQDIVEDPAIQKIALASNQLSLARFSQIQELEADAMGIKTLARAGYDPYAAARFLTSMARYAAWKTALPADGGSSADFLSSHPSTPERISEAVAIAGSLETSGGTRDQAAYLATVDGLLFGDNPTEGYVRGRDFLHAKLGLAFTVPAGFQLENTARAVLASDATGIALRFDGADLPRGGDLVSYLTSGWINGLDPASLATTSVNGMPAAVASAAARGFYYRIAVVRFGDRAYRFLFASKVMTPAFEQAFQATVASFRPLSPAEQSTLKPLKLKVVSVRAGDTAESFGADMRMMERSTELFRVLNGLGPADQPAAGSKVKIVADP